ncbi:hypothetical protein L1286_20330 [Pseudoalteromonas sp. SMS1]|uniref:hypothetical protein n=1 Tax=Pseudoalteromonas sp. SMS1 TaxID=2908894 RepID=UPI001F3BE759|nr:hypothetical protein [Pseudoalteromonas sp. SMS1]MCF2859834.1 hypothetical protein [Pseudoalteromonas sp. SMS1]
MQQTKIRHWALCGLAMLTAFKSVSSPHLELENKVSTAQQALIQGEPSLAHALISKVGSSELYEFHILEILYLLELEKTSEAIAKLTAFEKRFSQRAATFSFSSEAWRTIGHQSNIFSKRQYYKKAVQSKIKAGILAPESGRYLTMQASAFGQSKSYGGDAKKQAEVVEKIVKISKKWGYIARINLAQNNDEFGLAHQIARLALDELPNDFDILERAAQLQWTTDNDQLAQAFFARACDKKPMTAAWYHTVRWINACYQVAIFAAEEAQNKQLGVQALLKLFEEYQLPTESNYELITLYISLAEPSEVARVKPLLQHIIESTDDVKLKTNAKKQLASINNSATTL